jgi:hypothetical protein
MLLLRSTKKLKKLDTSTLWKLNMYRRWKFTLQGMESSKGMVSRCTIKSSLSRNSKLVMEHSNSKGLVNKYMIMLCQSNSSSNKFLSLIDLSWNLTRCLLTYPLQGDLSSRAIRLCLLRLSIKEICRQCLLQGDNCLPTPDIQNSLSPGPLLKLRSFSHLWVSIIIRQVKKTTLLKK